MRELTEQDFENDTTPGWEVSKKAAPESDAQVYRAADRQEWQARRADQQEVEAVTVKDLMKRLAADPRFVKSTEPVLAYIILGHKPPQAARRKTWYIVGRMQCCLRGHRAPTSA